MKSIDVTPEKITPFIAGLREPAAGAASGDFGSVLTQPKLSTRAIILSTTGATPSRTEFERLMGENDLVDEFFFERALAAARPVCRIVIRQASGRVRGYATGFMVSPRLMMTNEHVFSTPQEAAPSVAEFNFKLDIAGNPEPSYRFQLRPDLYFFNDTALDFALVAVEPVSMDGSTRLERFGYHRLIAETGKVMVKEWMTIVQHPTGQPRQWAIRENQCIDDSNANVLWYASDTAQGSSGSPVFNDSFQIVALHHSGVAKRNAQGKYILKDGRLVASLAEADDSQIDWIANAGIRVSRICASVDATAPEKGGYIAEFNSARRGDDVLTVAYRQGNQPEAHEMDVTSNPPPAAADKLITVNKARVVIGSLVLELDAALGQGVAPAVTAVASQSYPLDSDASSSAVETFKEPIIDADYDSRHGFDANFLGVETPLPQVADPSLIAKTLAGDEIIPYEHFSLVMHRERKLAIFTAANVDGRAKAKKPEPGHKYTRKELTGLGDNDIEKWVNDPRLADEFQIPDKFYTKDRGAFDKGHITRREDVCWGNTFDDVQRANGDTFHVTNCSPQRGNFNQSGKSGIWGQLENFIGAQSGSEKYCIFAGPVLANTDKVFAGTERVQIPDRFWKVVAATTAGNLQVFAFVLEQDLTDLDLEFYVDAEWKARQVSLTELEETVALVLFPSVYHDADQA